MHRRKGQSNWLRLGVFEEYFLEVSLSSLASKIKLMEFCPTCGNMLQFELPNMGKACRFFCLTCPYVAYLENRVKIKRKQHLVKKELEPIICEDDMKNAAQTEATCPKCSFGKAAFMQIQLRSADEPASTFYKCMNQSCSIIWRED